MKLKLDENIHRSHNPHGQLWIVEPGRLRIHEETESE